jgi:hypothetical protein
VQLRQEFTIVRRPTRAPTWNLLTLDPTATTLASYLMTKQFWDTDLAPIFYFNLLIDHSGLS